MPTRYVALLRGINVGKAKRVAMADLRALIADLGYEDVRTLLNSGNVVFSGRQEKPGVVGSRIQRAVAERLGVESRVIALTGAAFATAVTENPLASVADNPSRLLLALCDDPRRLKLVKPLMRRKWDPEALAVGTRAAYLWCPEGILASRLLEEVGKLLGESTTIRNWATTLRIQGVL